MMWSPKGPKEADEAPERSSQREQSEGYCHKMTRTAIPAHPAAGASCSAQQEPRCFPALPHRTEVPCPPLGPISYVGGIVEQEREASSGAIGDEVPGELVVEWHQLRERDWLLHDALVPEQWHWH